MMLLKLLEKLVSETPEVSGNLDVMMNESGRQVVQGMKRSRWGRYLFNISLVLALLAAMSFLASVWWPAVSNWFTAV
jgi:hypothetical protein